MAKFSAMTISSILKQGLAYSASTLAETAAFELPKLGATLLVGKYLGVKALSGIGVVNPALSLQILDVGKNFIFGSYRPDPSLNQTGQIAGRTDEIKKGASSEAKAPMASFTTKGSSSYLLNRLDETSAHKEENLVYSDSVFVPGVFPSLRNESLKNNITSKVRSHSYSPPLSILPYVDKDTAAALPSTGSAESKIYNMPTSSDRSGSFLAKPYSLEKIFDLSKTTPKDRKMTQALGENSVRRYKLENINKNERTGVNKEERPGLDKPFWEEFAQSHRFLVYDNTDSAFSVFEWQNGSLPNTLAAGFSSCTPPSYQAATTEIKEGTWECPRVFITGLSAGHITLRKGLVQTRTGFYLWMMNALRGLLTRRTLRIVCYRKLLKAYDTDNLNNGITCVWTLYNCLPVAYRPSGEWDANSGKVQISELDVHFEWFEEETGRFYLYNASAKV